MEDLSPQPKKQVHIPLIKARQIVESANTSSTKFASEVGFRPVTTMSVGDKKIYIRPIKNTISHSVSPGVVGPTGKVAVHGERTISLSQGLHSEVKNKVTKAINNFIPQKPASPPVQKYIRPEDLNPSHLTGQTAVKTVQVAATQAPVLTKPEVRSVLPTSTSTKATSPSNSEQLKKQLDEINKMLFEQIKQKIAVELAKQGKLTPVKTTAPTSEPRHEEKIENKQSVVHDEKNEAQTKHIETTPIHAGETKRETPAAEKPAPVSKPPTVETKDHDLPNFGLKAKLEKPVISVQIPPHWEQPKPVAIEPKQKPIQQKTPEADKESYKTQISQLEDEIKILVKEVENLDKTVQSLEQEKTNTELTTLERRIEVDQTMLAAIAEWRMALNNLINSHSIAIKYLKEKTDHLEQQTSHEAKHNQLHKPKTTLPEPTDIVFEQKRMVSAPLEAEKELVLSQAGKTETTKIPVEPSEQTSSTTTPALVTSEQKPETKEVQATSFEAVRDLVKQVMEKEKQQTPVTPVQPDVNAVKNLVKEELQAEKQNVETPPVQPDTNVVKDIVRETLKEELPKTTAELAPKGPASTVYVKEVDKSAVIPEGAQTGVVVKEQPIIGNGAQTISINTTDIEKQILEQAEKEEAVKEAVRKAKEEAELKIKVEREKKDQAVSDAAKKAGDTQVKLVEASEDLIKAEVEKLKSSLTTIDNKQMTNLSKEDRTKMIRQLENLENQTTIAKQYDEIKSAAERRRINAELSGMLHQIGEKPPEQLPPTQNPEQKMQTLKVEEKKQTSPAQKAKLIAEIKELERQSQASKAADRSRPTVKAQPAFGKMLPNTPTIPNVINGIVKDNKGLLLSTVVLIVKDDKGDPVRAFKTNKIGQFALSTPVPNGVYTLELEKDGYDFDIIEVDVNGAIMQPIEIKAK